MNADVAEIREAITDEHRVTLREAMAGVCAELHAAADDEATDAQMVALLGYFLSLTAGGWTDEARTEWQKNSANVLGEFPAALLIPALERAIRTIAWPNKLVPTICEMLDARTAKLREEREQLAELMEIAG